MPPPFAKWHAEAINVGYEDSRTLAERTLFIYGLHEFMIETSLLLSLNALSPKRRYQEDSRALEVAFLSQLRLQRERIGAGKSDMNQNGVWP
jgi:hypothetical protein